MCKHAGSRRDFFRQLVTGSAAGASLLELAVRRAAWAQAMAPGAGANLFDVQKITADVYFAYARPQAIGNCNAAIFVNSADVLVVDAHSKPSAAAALIAQIKEQITPKPVRYLVDTHFHWDHAQGNAGYRAAFGKKLDIVASDTTKKLLVEFSKARLKESLDPAGHPFSGQPHVPELLDAARRQLSAAASPAEKNQIEQRIRQLEAFEAEMKDYSPVLPNRTFSKTYVIKDKSHELHIEFHGRAHTAGDVVVFCPQKRVVATGDMILGTLPFLGDSYPKEWPQTIDSLAKLDFDYVSPGHGRVQQGKQRLTDQRNYLAELAERVESARNAGRPLSDIQKSIPVTSLKSFEADGYGAFLAGGRNAAEMQAAVNVNIEHIYNRLGQT